MTIIEVTDYAIQKLLKKKSEDNFEYIRIGITGGGCAGYEYVIEYADSISENDNVEDYGKFKLVVDNMSMPYLEGATLDWVKDGINEYFKIINPQELSSCGCGVSVQFA